MTDPRREGEGSRSARTTSGSTEQDGGTAGDQESRAAGTNRDFDEKQESKNQGHGHPREERGTND